jgi:hypothetical protein
LRAFEGVDAIEFDCETAVLTMKPGAAEITQKSATEAIEAKGWGVKDFKSGVAELLTVNVFQLSGTKAADHAALAKKLLGEIKGAKEVVIDTAGRAVVTLGPGAEALTEASLAALLKAAHDGWSAKDLETKRLPRTLATYVVEVPGMAGADEAKRVLEALQALPKVVVVQVFHETKSAQIRLKEPCDKIADDVAAALKARGLESKTAIVEAKPAAKDG